MSLIDSDTLRAHRLKRWALGDQVRNTLFSQDPGHLRDLTR